MVLNDWLHTLCEQRCKKQKLYCSCRWMDEMVICSGRCQLTAETLTLGFKHLFLTSEDEANVSEGLLVNITRPKQEPIDRKKCICLWKTVKYAEWEKINSWRIGDSSQPLAAFPQGKNKNTHAQARSRACTQEDERSVLPTLAGAFLKMSF